MSPVRSRLRSPLLLALVALVVLLVLAGTVGRVGESGSPAQAGDPSDTGSAGLPSPTTGTTTGPADIPPREPYVVRASATLVPKPALPGGGLHVFGHHHRLTERVSEGIPSVGLPLASEGWLLLETDDWTASFRPLTG